jgi:two-component system, OmpR family, sensor histidine kinase SenX3
LRERRRAIFVVIGVALIAVAWADVGLVRLFLDERDDARARIDLERLLIEAAARAAALDELRGARARAEAEAEAIREDPLRSPRGLVEIEGGRQVLPRPAPARSPSSEASVASGQGRALYEEMAGGLHREGEQSELADAVQAVQGARGDEELTRAVRAYLALRAHTRLPAHRELPAALVVAEELAARPGVDPGLLQALLKDGRRVGASRIEPIQAQLLDRARELSADDARFFFERVIDVCGRAGVSTEALHARWGELAPPLALPPVIEAERLFPGVVWIARARPAARDASGVRIDEAALLAAVAEDLRARQMLRAGEALGFEIPPEGVAPAAMTVTLRSERLARDRASAEGRFRVKSALLGGLTAMAAALLGVLLVDARRRRRYEELRSNFVAAVSHELRTPLASMRLLVESMATRVSDERTREKLLRLGTDVDGLDFLVENILSFSRLERGRLSPRKERVSLAEIVTEAATRARAEAPGVQVQIDASPDVEVRADPELVALVVHNLVRNAWQHHPRAERRVAVRLDSGGGLARVSVEDDGAGIAEVDRERIFLEFERGSRASSRGTGLGLALCRQIARAHGGDVALASTGPTGSTFVLTLPLEG